ncbi:hypothetical protein EYF80_011834 [Liparis tanakae]|uniref:Uncharacterized protein n=1 Tax=Liparis tanakae TaxID=230148 RepID=A0A4Z2IJH2_9TELE|nr:hypothetical protein EYF80_011834 [Liparis tanakae]
MPTKLLHLKKCLTIHLSLHAAMRLAWHSSRMPSRSEARRKTSKQWTSYSQTLVFRVRGGVESWLRKRRSRDLAEEEEEEPSAG